MSCRSFFPAYSDRGKFSHWQNYELTYLEKREELLTLDAPSVHGTASTPKAPQSHSRRLFRPKTSQSNHHRLRVQQPVFVSVRPQGRCTPKLNLGLSRFAHFPEIAPGCPQAEQLFCR